MNAKLLLFVSILCGIVIAQSDQKFQLYGFADVSVTKYFPKEESFVRSVYKMDELLMFNFDHLNIYGDFRPNDRLRFLTELSFQDKPVYFKDQAAMIMRIPGMESETVLTEAKTSDTNQTMKGIVKYEWGSFSVERAIASVGINRYWNWSFGKFITPAGIWNVDHGSPVIMTINQPSQYTFREMYPKSQLGIMENGTFIMKDVDLSYSAYLSSGRGNPSIRKYADLAVGGQLRLGLPLLNECNIGISGYTGVQSAVVRTLYMDFNMADFTYTSSTIDKKLFKYREVVGGLDFRIKQSGIMLQAEFNYQYARNVLRDDKTSGILGTYLLASVDVYQRDNFQFIPYAYWELVRYSDTENNPSLFSGGVVAESSAGAQTAYMMAGYMKIMAGINMKIVSNLGIKVEFNFTRLLNTDSNDPNKIADDKDKLSDVPGLATQFYISF
jgi:hypothetical protein